MKHNRPVTENDRELLIRLQAGAKEVVLTPVFHNGEARQAFAILEENEAGVYLRLLGVALNPTDSTLDKLGHAAAFHPPTAPEVLN